MDELAVDQNKNAEMILSATDQRKNDRLFGL